MGKIRTNKIFASRAASRDFCAINFSMLIALAAVLIATDESFAAPKPPAGSTSQLPQKLPPKKPTSKRTIIDFSNSADVVIAPRNPRLNSAIQKSEAQKNEAEVRVQSRVFVPAPPGDLSEIPSVAPIAPRSEESQQRPAVITQKQNQKQTQNHSIPLILPPEPQPELQPEPPLASAPASPVVLPPIPVEPMKEFSNSASIDSEMKMDATIAVEPSVAPSVESSTKSSTQSSAKFTPPPSPNTLAFVRTGYLQAKYGKFDRRMKDGATYVGLGVAREFETTWGSFEARASMDAYHAMDQSITVDNLRMLATRTEVGYWFTKTRVRPGISLGLGWTDYSVRSYRAISSATDPTNQTVVLKTHAKSQAFTVIPGTSLRIEVADGLVIDTQTEFLAILGGDSSEAVQGLSFGIALGWIF